MIPAEGTDDVGGAPLGEGHRSAAATSAISCTHKGKEVRNEQQMNNDAKVSQVTVH